MWWFAHDLQLDVDVVWESLLIPPPPPLQRMGPLVPVKSNRLDLIKVTMTILMVLLVPRLALLAFEQKAAAILSSWVV